MVLSSSALTVVQGVGSGGWQYLLGQALHLVRDVASAGPLGWKAALTRWSDLGLHAPGYGIEQLSSG